MIADRYRFDECAGKEYLSCVLSCIGLFALIIVEFFPKAIIGVFGAANESTYYTDFAVKAFRIYFCMMVLACVNKATFVFLQAMGKAASSTFLSMVREVVFGVGFALILPLFFGLDGVLYSMPVSGLLTAVVSFIIILLAYKQLNRFMKENAGTNMLAISRPLCPKVLIF